MLPGKIVILDGVPRSGKSSIAKVIQETFEGVWVNLGVDNWMRATPERFQPGIGLRPGGERPDLEPVVASLYGALHAAIAAISRSGVNVVVDIGYHDGYSKPLRIFEGAQAALAGLPVLLVGVRCPLEAILKRRGLDPVAGVPPPISRWANEVHRGMSYDLEVDTSVLTPEACADAILSAFASRGFDAST